MVYDYSDLLTRVQLWAQQAFDAGRVSAVQADALLNIDARSSADLFDSAGAGVSHPPLIVAFMGGTGVGKSALLNRLAGREVAKSGVERPTSREVTLYHHQALNLQQLPGGLSLHGLQISSHDDLSHQRIVWMDMPDFDSIEQGNQTLVWQWLPHIDVLIYVVSPERYRDSKAWRLLLQEGAKHAWLFVMNQWDRCIPAQFEDFKQQLTKAGFQEPLLFRTSCSEPAGDDFAELLKQLFELAGEQQSRQLMEHHLLYRRKELKRHLQQLQTELQQSDYQALRLFATQQWQKYQQELQQGLSWALLQTARNWVEQPGQNQTNALWDDWAQSRLVDLLDELVLSAAQYNISGKPLKAGLQAIELLAEKQVRLTTESVGRLALLNPGNALQRFLLRLTAVCETLLPLLAMTAVAYQVYFGFYQGGSGGAYLGVDFAVHSCLLIGLSWLMPFFLHKKLQPSLQKTALRGLQRGLHTALGQLEAEIETVLDAEQLAHTQLLQQLAELIEGGSMPKPQPISSTTQNRLLARVLPVADFQG